ncbi:hypothetical protein DFH28DRAFT_921298 [Melampsora americana]|nr:hypothetical protein DFH28DRAFT_921298 [Melampsora americana]
MTESWVYTREHVHPGSALKTRHWADNVVLGPPLMSLLDQSTPALVVFRKTLQENALESTKGSVVMLMDTKFLLLVYCCLIFHQLVPFFYASINPQSTLFPVHIWKMGHF